MQSYWHTTVLSSAYQAVRLRWCACAADADADADAWDGVEIVSHAVSLLLGWLGVDSQ